MTPGCLAANPKQTTSQDSFQSFAKRKVRRSLGTKSLISGNSRGALSLTMGPCTLPWEKTIHETDDVGRLKFSLECLEVLGELVSWGSLEPLWGCPCPQQL